MSETSEESTSDHELYFRDDIADICPCCGDFREECDCRLTSSGDYVSQEPGVYEWDQADFCVTHSTRIG